MNEITKIHLGRQAFTIAVDAYKELEQYLHAIEREVGDKAPEVTKEVELRMAELLAERGVGANKVILTEDVTFLKQQLGTPHDFREEDDDQKQNHENTPEDSQKGKRRLFRDTQHAMIAGVAAGLAAYARIPAWVVRIAFVLTTLAWGWGILAYIVLWLLVPEAKSSSNRLEMQGKAVTVATLKNVAARADVSGATRRAGRSFGRMLEKTGVVVLAAVGVGFTVTAALLFMGAMIAGTYLLANGMQAYGVVIFPIGVREVWIVLAGLLAIAALAVLLLFIGLAMIRRTWFSPGWVVAAVIGLFLAGASISGGLMLDAAPMVAQRVDALYRTQTVAVAPFQHISLRGKQSQFTFQKSDQYEVVLSYAGNIRQESLDVAVADGILSVDTSALTLYERCDFPCWSHIDNVEVIVRAPSLSSIEVSGEGNYFQTNNIGSGQSLTVTVDSESSASFNHLFADKIVVAAVDDRPGAVSVRLNGLRTTTMALAEDYLHVSADQVQVNRAGLIHVIGAGNCDLRSPLVLLGSAEATVQFDDLPALSATGLQMEQQYQIANPYNCVAMPSRTSF